MAVVALDGFDLYAGIVANTGLQSKWVAPATIRLSMQTGRFGGQCVRQNYQNNSGITSQIYLALPSNYSAIGVGFAFRAGTMSALSATPTNNMLMYLADNAGVFQVGLAVSPDGTLTAYRLTGANAGTSLGASASGKIITDTWHYIEFTTTISDTVGTVGVTVDGVSVLSLTGQDTRNGTPTTVGRVYFGQGLVATNVSFGFDVDDFYVIDSASTLGERRVETLHPSADTASKSFVASTGTDNYACVDEATVSTTDYVQGSTVGDLDLYDLGDLSSTPSTIDAVQLVAFAEKTDANSRAFALVADLGGTQVQSSDLTLASSYVKYASLLTSKPGGGSWNAVSVNGLKAGPKVTV